MTAPQLVQVPLTRLGACMLLTMCALTRVGYAGTVGPYDVIGGQPAAPGAWPDIAGVQFADGLFPSVECTGVLVAPTVVLSAAHCDDSNLVSVRIGSHNLDDTAAGETIPVSKRFAMPNWISSYDILVLVLAHPATARPRPLATGWAALDLVDGAAATLVGYGAIDRQAQQYTPVLQQADTTITDAACARSVGCNAAAKPAGELGAGGNNVDTCPGDSGGPLYLRTSYGTFVAGITSRAYDDATDACGDGGLYTRPDKVVAWIEEQAGVPVAQGPRPEVAPITMAAGERGVSQIVANDPVATSHTFTVESVSSDRLRVGFASDGSVAVCATGEQASTEKVVIKVTDRTNAARAQLVTLPVQIAAGANALQCATTFDDGAGCQCQSARQLSPVTGFLALLCLGSVGRVRRGRGLRCDTEARRPRKPRGGPRRY